MMLGSVRYAVFAVAQVVIFKDYLWLTAFIWSEPLQINAFHNHRTRFIVEPSLCQQCLTMNRRDGILSIVLALKSLFSSSTQVVVL